MDAELKAKWTAALRSGEFKQGKRSLRPTPKTVCCLQVLRIVADQHENLIDWDGLGVEPIRDVLIRMNDDEGKSFSEIADYIEWNI